MKDQFSVKLPNGKNIDCDLVEHPRRENYLRKITFSAVSEDSPVIYLIAELNNDFSSVVSCTVEGSSSEKNLAVLYEIAKVAHVYAPNLVTVPFDKGFDRLKKCVTNSVYSLLHDVLR